MPGQSGQSGRTQMVTAAQRHESRYSRVSAALKWAGLASASEASAIPAYWLRRRYEIGTVSMVAALALLLFDIEPWGRGVLQSTTLGPRPETTFDF